MMWSSGSLQAKDPDGTISFVDILLHQLAELILNKPLSDLSVENVMTIETLVLTVFDTYWQSELKVKNTFAELIGDKYIQCLSHLHEVLLNFLGEDQIEILHIHKVIILSYVIYTAVLVLQPLTAIISLYLVNELYIKLTLKNLYLQHLKLVMSACVDA